MAATRDVVVRFLGNSTGLNQAANSGGAAVGKFSDKARKVAKMAAAGVAAAGVAAVAFIKAGVQGLAEGEEAESKFAQVVGKVSKAVGVSADAVKAHAEAIQRDTKFTYEDALATSGYLVSQDALQKTIKAGTATVDELTNLTLDLATVQGVDGPAAAKSLAKWLAAPEKASKALLKAGVQLSAGEQAKIKAWVEGGDTAKAQGLILDKLKAKTEGAAAAAGQTMTGQMERAKNAFGEVQESLASSLMPTITKLMGWLVKVTAWMQKNPGIVRAVVIVLGALAAVIGTVSAVMLVLNTVMAANPFVLAGVAIAALVVGLVILYKKFDTARYIINAAIKAITLPILTWVDAALWGFETILKGLGHLPKWLGGGKFDTAAEAVGKLRGGIDKIRDGILALPTSAANDFAAALKKMTKALEAIPKVTNVRIDVQTRNTVADVSSAGRPLAGGQTRAGGGPVFAGRSYLIGERGPEVVTFARSGRVTPNHELGGGGEGGGGPMTVNIHATGPTLRDIVRVEVSESKRALRTAILAGARRS